MHVLWTQPVPCADSGSVCMDMVSYPAPVPMDVKEEAQRANIHDLAPGTHRKMAVNSSTARRQRRRRATERAAEMARLSGSATARAGPACPQASPASAPSPEASASDSSHAPTCAAEGSEVQGLMAQLTAGGEERSAAIFALRGCVWHLSRGPLGCRVVQLALEVASSSDAKALVEELHGHVEEAMYSPHANFVLQKVIEALPASVASFISQELAGKAVIAARHRYGCRILCRLLEHSLGTATALIDEFLEHAEGLCRHTFGHYVMKAVLEHGTVEQKHRVARAIWAGPSSLSTGHSSSRAGTGLVRNAMHRNASYVTEKVLEQGSAEDVATLARALAHSKNVQALGQSPHGCHVVKAMLRIPEMEQMVQAALLLNGEHLRATKYGSKLMQELGQSSPTIDGESGFHLGAAAA